MQVNYRVEVVLLCQVNTQAMSNKFGDQIYVWAAHKYADLFPPVLLTIGAADQSAMMTFGQIGPSHQSAGCNRNVRYIMTILPCKGDQCEQTTYDYKDRLLASHKSTQPPNPPSAGWVNIEEDRQVWPDVPVYYTTIKYDMHEVVESGLQ